MPMWEYCRIVWISRPVSPQDIEELEQQGFEGEIVTDGSVPYAKMGHLSFMDTPQEATSTTDLAATIAWLGREGWELVTHTGPDTHQVQEFFFKRILEASGHA